MTVLLTIAAALLGGSMLAALLSHSLRRYSTVALEELFSEAGREKDLERFLANEESLLMTASVWRLLLNLGIGITLAVYLAACDTPLAAALTAVIAGAVILVFAVAVPMAWARCGAESIIARLLPLLRVLQTLLWPILSFLGLFQVLVRRLAGAGDDEDPDEEFESELLSVVKEGELGGAFEEEEKEMIESIIELKDADVAEIMTPRTDMTCLAHDTPLAEARTLINDEGHSRIPVYRENLDTIVGLLYAKDLLAASGNEAFDRQTVSDIMRSPLFIPETKKLTELLHDFQTEGLHIAIVLDEYGGTAGLVTIEDVIEEIVGEITDEYDASEPEGIRRLSETSAEIGARVRVDEVNDELDIRLPEEEDYDTVGGFAFSALGTIPTSGERFDYRGLTITVLEADERRIIRLRIDGLDHFAGEES